MTDRIYVGGASEDAMSLGTNKVPDEIKTRAEFDRWRGHLIHCACETLPGFRERGSSPDWYPPSPPWRLMTTVERMRRIGFWLRVVLVLYVVYALGLIAYTLS